MVSFTNLEKKPDLSKRAYRLDKMEKLLELFNNPQNSFKSIHVAGSKGKGSTSGFISSILNSAGFKTGVYSSPHLLDYRERITNNHNYFPTSSYTRAIDSIKNVIDDLDEETLPGGAPTTFELMTLTAFLIFRLEKCQWAVIETGIGGRLDSTNVITPEASVITTIELEHTELLGDTIELIAVEKAGIIKSGKPVFISNNKKEILDVFKKRSQGLGSKLNITTRNFNSEVTKSGTFLIIDDNSYKIGLEGAVQVENALLAINVINSILPTIEGTIIRDGLLKTSIPGRFQIINSEPQIVLDGAHTKESILNTVKTFKSIYTDGTIIFGVISGKDIKSMAQIISENFDNIIISTPGDFKVSNLDEVEDIFKELNRVTYKIDSPKKALALAKKNNKPILVTGSFYMAGEIGKLL